MIYFDEEAIFPESNANLQNMLSCFETLGSTTNKCEYQLLYTYFWPNSILVCS